MLGREKSVSSSSIRNTVSVGVVFESPVVLFYCDTTGYHNAWKSLDLTFASGGPCHGHGLGCHC